MNNTALELKKGKFKVKNYPVFTIQPLNRSTIQLLVICLISNLRLYKISLFCIILSFFILSACQTSVVYSPSLNLPAKPLVKDDVQAGLGYELLGETSPSRMPKSTSNGLIYQVRYGFTDRFSMQFKGWASLETYQYTNDSGIVVKDIHPRQGFSVSGTVMLNRQESEIRFALIPTLAMALYDTNIEGLAGACWLAAWLPKLYIFNPYAGVGIALGWRNTNAIGNQYGIGLIPNLGIAFNIYKELGMNVEFSGAYIINKFDKTTTFIPSPSLMLSYKF